ncbi:UBC-like protein [Gloeophyllum trabeum ATCC 11539]|uniref:Ubiquitin-conjugating enzyme E2 6 n=1 Tax=Gloeophyllum trabeum (strain ATCC 11539 / FP-39264 / Madison 617) TaxID=670483 RepID=S7QBG7_GLOTA|nr:UBC-like protein [Gloeophyllum trabeum ATCC 11539]EPQ56697.1 UBC-like protein [Gloeophyllum trabeum ATCC 11539]
MASKAAYKRLTKEYVNMQKEPPPFVWAIPDEKNILTWNYIIRGPPDSPFAGGEYHGVLMFPSEYPFKPPGIKMYTPSGRFQPDKKICFSMSDFHPGSWNPAWSVATILTGLLSFMLSDELTTGSVTSSDSDKRAYAARSHAWNLSQRKFREAFPEFCTPNPRDLPNMGEKERGKPPAPETTNTSPSVSASPAPTGSQVSHRTNAVLLDATASQSGRASSAVQPSQGGDKPKGTGAGWADAWRQIIWEKWRWGLLIALAVIVSRVSSSN